MRPLLLTFIALSLVGFVISCGKTSSNQPSQQNDSDEAPSSVAVKNLRAQATQINEAFWNKDYGKLADFTHPSIFEAIGGRERYIEGVKSVREDLEQSGVRLKQLNLGEPSKLVFSAGDVYAIVPSEARLLELDGGSFTSFGAMIAVSPDRGENWKFIDAAKINGDRQKVKMLLPNFPDRLDVPVKKPPLIENL
jgi:hypothetical protein